MNYGDPTQILNYFTKAVDTTYDKSVGREDVSLSKKSREFGENPSVGNLSFIG